MAKSFNNIEDWLKSDLGQNALEHDTFNLSGYEDLFNKGKDIHDIRQALSGINAFMKNQGFGKLEIKGDVNKGSTLTWKPTSPNAAVSPDSYPSIEIGWSKDGLVIRNGLPTANNPLVVRGADGDIGFSSSLSVALDEINRNLRRNGESGSWKNLANQKNKLAQKIKTTIRMGMDLPTHMNPSIYSPNQLKEYREALDRSNINNLALEGQEALKTQLLYAYYFQSVYNNAKEKGIYGKGAPKTEKQFITGMQAIMDAARSNVSFDKLDSFVRNNYQWYYHNVWKGDVENYYKRLSGHFTQGGKKEGAPGIVGLGEPDIAFGQFENVGRKVMQNLRRIDNNKKFGDKGSQASGKTRIHTQWQYDLYNKYKQDVHTDLYYAGELEDKDITAAVHELIEKREKDLKETKDKSKKKKLEDEIKALKIEGAMSGFGKDASLMSRSAMTDFEGMSIKKTIDKTVSKEDVDDSIKRRLEKELRNKGSIASGTTREEIDGIVNDQFNKLINGKLSKKVKGKEMTLRYEEYVKDALHSIFKLDDVAKVTSFDSDENSFSRINTEERLDNRIFKALGGNVSDFRSVIGGISDEILGLAFEKAGYKKEDIYDGNGHLKMKVARQKAVISEKTIRSEISRKFQYVFDRYAQDGKTTGEELYNALKKYGLEDILQPRDGGKLEDYTGTDFTINNEALSKKFFHKNKRGGVRTPVNLLEDAINVGQMLGYYTSYDKYGNETDYGDLNRQDVDFSKTFKNKEGKEWSFLDKKFVDAMAVVVSSTDRYERVGRDTNSQQKLGWREMQSLEGTVADMKTAEGGKYAKAAEPFQKLLEKRKEQLAELEEKFQPYANNAKFVANSFRNDVGQFGKELRDNDSVVILSYDDIKDLKTFEGLPYDADAYGQGLKLGNNSTGYAAIMANELRRERYEELVKREMKKTHDEEKAKEALKQRGVWSYKDIKLAVDNTNESFGFVDENGKLRQTGYTVLALGDVQTPTDKSDLYMPDEGALSLDRQIRAIQDYHKDFNTANKTALAQNTGRKLYEIAEEIGDSIGHGGAYYDKYHTVTSDMEESGYFLLSALNENFSEEFKKLFGENKKGYIAPSMIMSTSDAKKIFNEEWKKEGGEQKIRAIYDSVMGKKGSGKNKSQRAIIKKIIESYDINSKKYKVGEDNGALQDFLVDRQPIIKFANDFFGGGIALSSDKNLVTNGVLKISKDAAGTMKGDMDGDRIAFFNAISAGDYDGAKVAIQSYYKHLTDYQAKAMELDGEDEFKLKKTNSVADLAARAVRSVGINASAKGAGIYGNLLFGVENILDKKGISQGSAASAEAKFAGNIALNIAHSLYQEGINTKNIKMSNGKMASEAEVADMSAELMTLMYQKDTWDTFEGMEKALSKMEVLGINKDGSHVFKSQIIGNLGLQHIKNNEGAYAYLSEMIERTKQYTLEHYGKNSDEYKRVKKDLEALKEIESGAKEGFDNLSNEVVSMIVTDKKTGLSSFLGKEGETIGQLIGSGGVYNFIPGYEKIFEEALFKAEGTFYDEETKKKYESFLNKMKDDREYEQSVKSEYSRINSASFEKKGDKEFPTSTTRRTQEVLPYISKNGKVGVDILNLLEKIKNGEELIGPSNGVALTQAELEKEYGPSIRATTQGTLFHEAAELNGILQKYGENSEEYKSAEKHFAQTKAEERNILSKFMTSEEIDEFIDKSSYLGQSARTSLGKRIEYAKGKMIGQEAEFSGFLDPNDKTGEVTRVKQIFDYLYVTYDEKGRPTLHVGDYKTNASGKPTGENILQLADYVDTLQLLKEDIASQNAGVGGVRTFDTYIGSDSKSTVLLGQLKRFREAAEKENSDLKGKKGYEKAVRESYEKRLEQFREIYDVLKSNESAIAAEFQITDSRGVSSVYDLNIHNANLRDALSKYKDTGYVQAKDKDGMSISESLNAGDTSLLTKSGTFFGGDIKDLANLIRDKAEDYTKAAEDLAIKIIGVDSTTNEIKRLSEDVNPDQEKILKLKELLSSKREEVYGSSDITSDEEAAKYWEGLQKDISDARKEGDLTKLNSLTEKEEKFKKSLYYKTISAKEVIAKENVKVDGREYSTEEAADLVVGEKVASLKSIFEDNEAAKDRIHAVDQKTEALRLSKKLTEQQEFLRNEKNSLFLTEDERADAGKQYDQIAAQLEYLDNKIKTYDDILLDKDGKYRFEEDEKSISPYDYSPEAIQKEAEKKFKESEADARDEAYKRNYKGYSDYLKISSLIKEAKKKQALASTPEERQLISQQIELYERKLSDLGIEYASGESNTDEAIDARADLSEGEKEERKRAKKNANLESQIEESKTKSLEEMARDQYTDSIKKARKIDEQIADLTNESESKFTSDDEKLDIVSKIKLLQEQRDEAEKALQAAKGVLQDGQGNWKEGSENLSAYDYSPEAIQRKSAREARIAEQQKDQNFFNKAYRDYMQPLRIQNQIAKYEGMIDIGGTPQEEKIWQSEIENLKQQLQLLQENPLDHSDMKGYSEGTDLRAKERAELEAQSQKLNQDEALSRQKAYFGIDGEVMQWIDRLMAGGALKLFLNEVKKAFSDMCNKAIQLNKAMTNLRMVTGDSASDAKTLVSQYSDLAKQLGVTTTETVNAANEWARQGYNTAEILDLVKSSTYLSKLGMLDATTAVKDLTSAMKGFKIEASDSMSIVDKLTALDVEAATSAGDIAEGLAQFANLASLSGVDINQASSYVATIADVTQQSGSSVGQAMKTIISRYGNVKASAYNNLDIGSDDEAEGSLNDVETVLKKMGISIRDTNLEFKDFDEVLDEIADKWENLDSVSKKAIANAFAGTRQQESFVTLMENYDNYKKYLKTSQDSSGTAEKKYQSYQDSYEAARNRRQASLEKIANDSSLINLLTSLTNTGTMIIDLLQQFLKYLPTIIAGIEGLRALKGKGIGMTLLREGEKLINGGEFGFGSFKIKTKGIKNEFESTKIGQEIIKKKQRAAEKRNSRHWTPEKAFNKEVEEKGYGVFSSSENDEKNPFNKWSSISLKKLKEDKKKYEVANSTANTKQVQGNQTVWSKIATDYGKDEVAKDGSELKPLEDKQGNQSGWSLDHLDKAFKAEKQPEQGQQDNQANWSENAEVVSDQQKQLELQRQQQLQQQQKVKAQKRQGVMMGLSMAAAGVSAAITTFSTAATTHKTTRTNAAGEEKNSDVQSSERAQQIGGATAAMGAAVSGVPIIGQILSIGFNHIGTAMAKAIDAERDTANNITATATENIAALQSMNSTLDSIGEDVGSLESKEAVSELMSQLWSGTDEGKTQKALLSEYLGGDSKLYDTLTAIKNGDKEAYNELKLAQIQAEKDQVQQKYASQFYEAQDKESKAYEAALAADNDSSNDIDHTASTWNSIGKGYGTMIASELIGGVAGAAAMGIAAASGVAAASVPVIGWVVGAIGGLTAAVMGTIAVIQDNAYMREQEAKEQMEAARWNTLTTSEKIDEVKGKIDDAQAANNNDLASKYEELLDTLEEQNALESEMRDEIDDLTLQASMISATVTYTKAAGVSETKALSDLSVSELRNLGKDQILLSYAKATEEQGGLLGKNVWADEGHTQLSDSGYTYILSKLKDQNDEEINAVLNGSTYTLDEALALKNGPKGNTREIQELLQSFADALGVPVEKLEGMSDLFGMLTLAETQMSPSEIRESLNSYTDLVAAMVSGAGDISESMETIISKYPELIKYMGDTPTLFAEMGKKMTQMSNSYLQSQYESVASTSGYYSSIKDDLYGKLGEDAQRALDSANITNLNDLLTFVTTNTRSDGTKTAIAQEVSDAIAEVTDEYGTQITSSILKDWYTQLIDYKTKALDTEIDNLNEQKEALESINSQREYENKLIEAKLKLENAISEKKRVYRAGVGWTYESDQTAILEAQENLESVKNEKTISSLESQIAELEQQKSDLESVFDNANNETLKNLYDSFTSTMEGEDGVSGVVQAIKAGVTGISSSLTTLIKNDEEKKAEEKTKALAAAKEAWNILQQTDRSNGAAYNTALSNFHSAMSAAKNLGASEEDTQGNGWENGSKSSQSQSAWEVSEGDESKQTVSEEYDVVLNEDGKEGRQWFGRVNFSSFENNASNLNYILKDLNSDDIKGFIWGKDSNGNPTLLYSRNNPNYLYAPKSSDGDFKTYADRLKSEANLSEAIYLGYDGKPEAVYYNNGTMFKITGIDKNGQKSTGGQLESRDNSYEAQKWVKRRAAKGSLGLEGNGGTLINELGTEAIVTPGGTITALPSHTGIVPADITKNLWELGEIAPSIMRTLTMSILPDSLQSNSVTSTTDESVNISTMNITMNPDGSFDADDFIKALRSKVSLTKNLR